MIDIRIGDLVTMKKPHPCGAKDWCVLRTGADIKLRCCGCGHEVMLPRNRVEKAHRAIRRRESSDAMDANLPKNFGGK